jgi:hypothetical protein
MAIERCQRNAESDEINFTSQRVPVYTAGQLHEYPLTPSIQVPPFAHGLLPHSLMSV